MVRCGRCAYSWHQMPAVEELPLELSEALPDPALLSNAPAALPPEPRFDPRELSRGDIGRGDVARGDVGRGDVAPYRQRRKRGGGLMVGWFLFFLVLGAILGGGWYWRDKVVAAVPELGKLYTWLGIEVAAPQEGRLEIINYTFGRRLVDSERKLAVAGEIANRSAQELAVPVLRARVLDQSGNELMTWDFEATAKTLAPGATTRFESLHEHPDYGGELDVQVGFVPVQ